VIQDQGTGILPDTNTAEGGRHCGDAYSGPTLDLAATPHRRALAETETEVAS